MKFKSIGLHQSSQCFFCLSNCQIMRKNRILINLLIKQNSNLMKNLIVRFLEKSKLVIAVAVMFLFVGVQQTIAQKSGNVNLVDPAEATSLLMNEIGSLQQIIAVANPQTVAQKQDLEFSIKQQQYYVAVYEAVETGSAVHPAVVSSLPLIFKDVVISTSSTGASSIAENSNNVTILDDPMANQAYDTIIELLQE